MHVKKKYSAWGVKPYANTLVEGIERPKFADGTHHPDCPDLIWIILAKDWNDACVKYHQLQGWEAKS